MKKLILATTFIVMAFSLGACNTNKDVSDVIIETDVGTITEEDFNKELQKRYGKQALQELVTIDILNDKYDIDDKQVDDEIEILKEEYGTRFELMLQQQGFADEEAFRSVVHLGLLQE